MSRVSPILLLATVVLCGCPTRPKYPVDGGGPDGGADARGDGSDAADVDAQPSDTGGGGDSGGVVLPTIVITSPANNTHTNASVSVAVAVGQGGTAPDQIALFENGTMLAILSSPFEYSWDTTTVPEGTYSLTAQATVAGKVVNSPPVTVVVDRTPPTVASVTPSTGATNVIFASPLQVGFSEAVFATTLPATAVSISGGATAVPTDLALSADGRTATITIKDRSTITLPATFSGTFAATITDLAGNKLTPPSPAWSWNVPDWIKTQTFPSDGEVALAVAPDLHPVVVYSVVTMVNSNYVYNVQVARHDGQMWKQFGSPTTDVDTGRNGYSIDVDAQSHPTVTWAQYDGGSLFIHVGSHDGNAWSTLPGVDGSSASATSATRPKVRVDATGHPIAAWLEDTAVPTIRDVFVARWTGTAWDRSYGGLGLNAGSALFGLDLVLDQQGNPIVGWQGSLGTGVSIWGGTSWARSPDVGSSALPSIAREAAGKPVIVARGSNTTVQTLVSNQWQPTIPTPVPVGSKTQDPVLALTPDQAPVVAWMDTTGPNKLSLAKWIGTKWDLRFGLFSAGASLAIQRPAVAVDAKGNIWVAWFEDGQARVWMSNY